MKTSTKILSIVTVLTFLPNIFLFKYLLGAFVPAGDSFKVQFSSLAWVSLSFLVVSLVLGTFLFFRFLKGQRLTGALFFSVMPLTFVYGGFVTYVSSVKDMNGATAQAMRSVLKIAQTEKPHNNLLWVLFATLVYLVILFVIILVLCKPLSKIEKVTKNLGDGRMKADDFKVGGTKQFQEIENSLNKINYQYKKQDNKIKQYDLLHKKSLSKQQVKIFGKDGVSSLEFGNQIKKTATVLLFCLEREQKPSKDVSLEENFNYINSYLKVIYPLIKRFGGFVDRYLGEKVLAVFSKPQEAISCAHALCRAIDAKNKNQKERHTLVCRLAIDTDDITFGIVGDEEKNPQILSDTLSNLEKMQEINTYIGSKVIFSKQSLNALAQNFQFSYRYVGDLTMSEEESVPIYESLEAMPKNKREKLKKLKNKFEAGVRAYNQKDYERAKEGFEFVLHYVPDDQPSYVYFNKALEKLKETK